MKVDEQMSKNIRFLSRLQQTKSSYDTMQWLKERAEMEKLVASKCRYQYVLGQNQKESSFLPEVRASRVMNTV
jgi:hypothetical protein